MTPYEPSPLSALVMLKHDYLVLLISAFATSGIPEGVSEFMLNSLIEWLYLTDLDDMLTCIADVGDEFNPEAHQHAINRYSCDFDIF
jgi:hypothetical protein